MEIKTFSLNSNTETEIAVSGGCHAKIKNLGDSPVFVSKNPHITPYADGVKFIAPHSAELVKDAAVYDKTDSGSYEYIGSIYALSETDSRIEIETGNSTSDFFISAPSEEGGLADDELNPDSENPVQNKVVTEINSQTTENTETLGYSAKNLFHYLAEEVSVRSGNPQITFTINPDKSITVIKTAVTDTVEMLRIGGFGKSGKYIINGGGERGSTDTWMYTIRDYTGQNTFSNKIIWGEKKENGDQYFEIVEDTPLAYLFIRLNNSYTTSSRGKTFFPMIRHEDIADPTYKPYQGKALDRLNNLQIGGRNLYTGTKDFSGSGWNNATVTNDYYNGFRVANSSPYRAIWKIIENKKVGEYYTVSAWIKHPSGDSLFHIHSQYDIQSITLNGVDMPITTFPTSLFAEWSRIEMTVKINEAASAADFGIGFMIQDNGNNNTNKLLTCGIKFERGTTATDWTPAPEDFESIIDSLETRIDMLENS